MRPIPNIPNARLHPSSRVGGISQHVKARAVNGDPAYAALWRLKQCYWCDAVVDPVLAGQPNGRTYDHMVPVSRSGGDDAANLRCSCLLCNNLRDLREPDDFRKVADHVIRPHRGDLIAMGHAFLAWDMLPEARRTWSYSGMPRGAINALVLASGVHDGFDLTSNRGFRDAASARRGDYLSEYGSLSRDALERLVDAMPTMRELKRAGTDDALVLAARRVAMHEAMAHLGA